MSPKRDSPLVENCSRKHLIQGRLAQPSSGGVGSVRKVLSFSGFRGLSGEFSMAFRPERRRLAKGPAETGVDALRPFNGGAEPPQMHAVQTGTPERRVSRISSGGGQFRPLSGTTRIGTSPMKRALRPGLLGVVLAAVFAVTPGSAANLSPVPVAPPSVVGGGASSGTVTLAAAAPTGGAVVT